MEARCLSPGDFQRLPERNQDEILEWLAEHGFDQRGIACIRYHDGHLTLDLYLLTEAGRKRVQNGMPMVIEAVVDCQRPFPWPGPMISVRPLQRRTL